MKKCPFFWSFFGHFFGSFLGSFFGSFFWEIFLKFSREFSEIFFKRFFLVKFPLPQSASTLTHSNAGRIEYQLYKQIFLKNLLSEQLHVRERSAEAPERLPLKRDEIPIYSDNPKFIILNFLLKLLMSRLVTANRNKSETMHVSERPTWLNTEDFSYEK